MSSPIIVGVIHDGMHIIFFSDDVGSVEPHSWSACAMYLANNVPKGSPGGIPSSRLSQAAKFGFQSRQKEGILTGL